jgi:hypothetical protein
MTDPYTLDADYWEAVEILADEHGRVRECVANKTPWTPVDPANLAWAMQTYQNWHQDDPTRHFLTFPWPEPGEVPDIPVRYFVPTETEKVKIQWFVDNFGGEDEEPWVKDMVELAKVVLEGVQ